MRLLVVNSGSSSLKAALYDVERAGAGERRLVSAEVSRLAMPGTTLRLADATGTPLLDEVRPLPDHAAALVALLDWLAARPSFAGLDAVGHRVVHGGAAYAAPVRITAEVMAALRALVPIDPTHMPAAIAGIEAVGTRHPDVPQVACFDTAFHRRMPAVAQRYALPRPLFDEGVLRYGFHGLSYEYVAGELAKLPSGAPRRAIVAHLGNGASVTALRDGASTDTSMGFSPLCGLVMGTRCGDLDPAVPLHLLGRPGMDVPAVSDLLHRHSGLLGLSGLSADMRDLLDAASRDPRAAEAVEAFCYQLRKYIGAYAAVLGGLDALVFTAGIGEHSAAVRARTCEGLHFLGIRLDPDRNARHAPVISPDHAPVTVRVIPTDEDVMIARHTRNTLT
jgi:acetate kinase